MLMLGFFMVGCSESVTSPVVNDEFSSSVESLSSDVNSSSSSVIYMSSSEMIISVSSAGIISSSSATAIVPSSSSVTLLPYQLLADTNFTNTSMWTVKDLGTIIAGNRDSYLGATYTMAPNLISVSAVGTSAPAFTQALMLPQGYTYRVESTIRIDQVSPTILDADIIVSSGIITSTGASVSGRNQTMQKSLVGSYSSFTASMDASTCYTKPATRAGYVYVSARISANANYAVPFKYSISKISVIATPCPF